VSKVTIVETRKQHAKVGVTPSFGASITTTGVEIVVVPNIDVVRRGVLIGFVAKLGSRSNGILAIRNLSRSSTLPISTIRVVGILQMALPNLLMIIHVNKIVD
jgi:hypothetical protein